MVNGNLVAKNFLQPANDLGGEGYFRQEIQHLLAPLDRLLDQFDINARLAATGGTVQQQDIFVLPSSPDLLHSALLLSRQAAGLDGFFFVVANAAHLPFV